jgi:hypothetical protein
VHLNILLKLNYYDRTIIDKFKYFITLDYYRKIIIREFKYFIKIKFP